MAEPTIDIDDLARPLPGDAPGGVPLPFDVRNNLDAWRNEPDPDFHDPAAPPPAPAEWGKVIATASDYLSASGKDLTAAVRLVEALTKKYAAARPVRRPDAARAAGRERVGARPPALRPRRPGGPAEPAELAERRHQRRAVPAIGVANAGPADGPRGRLLGR